MKDMNIIGLKTKIFINIHTSIQFNKGNSTIQTMKKTIKHIDSVLQRKTLKLSYLPNPSARAGYDTRSIFMRNLTGLNSEFSFS